MYEIYLYFCQLKPKIGLRLEFGIGMLRYSSKQLQKGVNRAK